MPRVTVRIAISIVVLFAALSVTGAAAPVIESFTVTPAVPVPGQNVTLRIVARDPDCTAPPCTAGCGAIIRSDLLVWSDDTGRLTGAFTGSTASASGSPWNASVTWIAPSSEGTYTVRANVADNGGMLCGGRQTKVATLQVNVSSARPPSIDSCTVLPSMLPAGATATITAQATDATGRPLTYAFAADAGTITHASPESNVASWTAPKIAGNIALRCTAIAGGVPATLQTMANVEIGTFVQTLQTAAFRATRTAALPDGRLAFVDGVNGIAGVATTSGSVAWSARDLRTPAAIAVAGDELFVLERGARRISVWSRSGSRLRELAIDLALPNQLAAGPAAGELSVIDTAASRVAVLSATTGELLRTVGDRMLIVPVGLAVNGGRIAVADAAAARVLIFDSGGTLRSTLGDSTALVRPQGLTWDAPNERFIVADSYSGELVVVGEENTIRGTLAGFGTTEGKLVNPIDVTLLAGSMLAVTTAGGELSLYRLSATLKPLAPPTSLAAADRANDDGGAIVLSWTESSDDPARVTAYRIERVRETAETYDIVEILDRDSASFVDTAVADGVCFRYRVVATDGAVEAASDATPCVAARNDLAPPAPSAVVAEVESPTRAVLEWDPVTASDLRGYVMDLLSDGAASPVSLTLSSNSVVVAELRPSTTYDVRVRAVDTAGNLSAAATTQLRTYADEPPAAPVAVVAEDAAEGGTLDVRWTAPATTLPIAKYRVVVTPSIEGWATKTLESATTTLRLGGLVNALPVRVSVTAITRWGRESEPAWSSEVSPSTPDRALPLVVESDDVQDAAGVALQFAMDAEKRELRLQYRALGTTLRVSIDETRITTLADTNGVWTDAAISIDKKVLKNLALHRLALHSSAFPVASARLSVRRVDFMPLPPRDLKVEEFNTVADLAWTWDAPRADLGVASTRDGVSIACAAPQLGRCRDTFLENGKQMLWTLRTVSPAGWQSEPAEARAHAKFAEGPPPVTDLLVAERDGGLQLSWTPLSSALTRNGAAVAVKAYRIYSNSALLMEVTTATAFVRDVDAKTLTVRSVDAEGRESQ